MCNNINFINKRMWFERKIIKMIFTICELLLKKIRKIFKDNESETPDICLFVYIFFFFSYFISLIDNINSNDSNVHIQILSLLHVTVTHPGFMLPSPSDYRTYGF